MNNRKISFHPMDLATKTGKPFYRPGKRSAKQAKALDQAKVNILCWVAENSEVSSDAKRVLIDPRAFAEYVKAQN